MRIASSRSGRLRSLLLQDFWQTLPGTRAHSGECVLRLVSRDPSGLKLRPTRVCACRRLRPQRRGQAAPGPSCPRPSSNSTQFPSTCWRLPWMFAGSNTGVNLSGCMETRTNSWLTPRIVFTSLSQAWPIIANEEARPPRPLACSLPCFLPSAVALRLSGAGTGAGGVAELARPSGAPRGQRQRVQGGARGLGLSGQSGLQPEPAELAGVGQTRGRRRRGPARGAPPLPRG